MRFTRTIRAIFAAATAAVGFEAGSKKITIAIASMISISVYFIVDIHFQNSIK